MTAPVIQFKRGLLANLPGLQAGEPGFTTDSYDLYVGLTSETATNKIIGSHRFWTNNSATTGSGVNLVEGTNNGTDFITLKAPNSLAGIVTYTFPGTDGSNGQALVTNGSGTLSFASVTTSAGTLTGAGAGITAFLVTPSSANLATAVTDETGSGSLVFANTPTLVTPVLGTPTSGTLTNCTGLPVSTGISGLGANVATFLATPSSANLASALTDETGSSSVVFSASPTFTGTATFASATATSVVVGSAVTITASGLTAGAAGIITASSFRPASGYYQSADGTNAFYVYNTSGNVSFQGTIGASQLNSAGGTKVVGLLGSVASFAGNVNVSGISSFVDVTANNINATGIVTATTFSGGLAVGNITGLGANVATFLATPSSANLASAITDETGSGALVFANTPTFTGGINASQGADLGRLRVTGISTLGQTNTTGLSNAGISTLGNATASTVNVSGFSTISGGLSVTSGGANITGIVTATTFSGGLAVGNITGLGANVSTFLATPSSANLASAVSDETGTGALVFANSPTLVTPTLGAASATSLTVSNDVTITGNLYVNGSTTQVNTTTTTIEDQLLDLGMVDGSAPSSDLNKDIGVLFNYFTASAKKAALFWDDSVSRVVAAADVTESTGVLTINTYADFEVKSLYVNGCTGQSEQVIACSGSKVIIQNATIDGGTF